ncbi:alkaline phosphatase PhoX [Thalassolituus sp. LLYu03]|uniref:alkaline phosphatase PhoX n=1 Tax=Thalassolituus sp. LLYu03 TaxID=3421656 RepID=UPI003D291BFE
MKFLEKNRLAQAVTVSAITAMLAACGGEDGKDLTTADHTTKTFGTELSFAGVAAPQTDADKRAIFASEATVGDGTFGGSYHTLARSGEDHNGVIFGQLVDQTGTVLQEDDGSIRVSNSNEHTSLLQVGSKLFSVSQMESTPGAMFLMELNQNSETGELTVKNMKQIDQSGVNGGWVHCAASVTPWQTHLASEEYEPDAKTNATPADFAANTSYYAKQLDYYTDENDWNPYFYGWNIEVAVNESAETTLTKHYSMGRLAFELAKVLPDSKTAYMTDDGTNVGFYMYVADTAGDLTAGTTYAAKFDQVSGEGQGKFNLSWISLGHATDAEIKTFVNNGTTFADIFDTESATDGVCPTGYTSINANGIGQECLKLKTGMEKAASRLETRRYAAMLGATTELRKEEGVTFDSKRNRLYVGISEIERGMENFKKDGVASTSYDKGGNNDLQLDGFNVCGGVYALDLASDSTIGSEYVAQNFNGLIAGKPTSSSYGPNPVDQVTGFESNKCHIDGLANPDNVTYMEGYDKLIIGEDSGSGHQNDVIWAYDFATESLTRIQTTPYGAETTSPYWYPNINGWAYLMSVVQHPYGESDGDKDTGAGETMAYTGYIGPFPGISTK